LHTHLIRDCFPNGLSDRDALLVFTIFHTCGIHLSRPLRDRPDCYQVAAVTQRHAAKAIADSSDNTSDERADDAYWYRRWITDTEYGCCETLADAQARFSPQVSRRMSELMNQFAKHPIVDRLEADE
jgi:hypothetical protein